MGKISLELLKERIADRYDPDYVVDLLGLDTMDILNAFEDVLLRKVAEFSEVEDADSDD